MYDTWPPLFGVLEKKAVCFPHSKAIEMPELGLRMHVWSGSSVFILYNGNAKVAYIWAGWMMILLKQYVSVMIA